VPQTVLGTTDCEYGIPPPVRMNDPERNVGAVGWPSTLRPSMYVRPFDAPGLKFRRQDLCLPHGRIGDIEKKEAITRSQSRC
jgi:hypothetical protein